MIVEMDGGIGHGKTGYLLDPEKTKNIDKYKDSKAIEHGLNIIRIDASKSNKEYISRKILESKIFSENELSNVDFDKCDEFTCINLLKYTCEEYEKLKPISCHDLSKILKMSFSTTLCYLNRGKELNICSYNGSQYMSNGGRRKVSCFDKNMNFIKTYNSIKEAESEIGAHGISSCCKGKRKSVGGYIWRYYENK